MRHKIIFSAIIPYFIFTACSTQEEWTSLFNGTDLSGWEVKAKPEDQGKDFWVAGDGYIEANSIGQPDHDYIWLYSQQEYDDFEIKFKFQAFVESPGNSGIQLRSRYDSVTYWLNGPQIDIHPQGYWRTGMMWDETRGNQRWLYPEVPTGEWVDSTMAISEPMFYFDNDPEWNEMHVIAKGNKIEAWLNGSKITEYDGSGVLDDELHQSLDVGQKGHIVFQIHSGDELKIRYKDIYLRKL